MSSSLNRSSTLERFERSNAIEIRNGMFDFYLGLPHIRNALYHHPGFTYHLIVQSQKEGSFGKIVLQW